MTTLDETPERQTGAQTVAPTSASALAFAASILGEASYTPEAELKRSLDAAGRAHEEEAAPVEQPVAAPVAKAPAPQPVVEEQRPSVVPPARVETPVIAPEPVKKGFFARLIDKLLGRG
jgi:hypothetical protein